MTEKGSLFPSWLERVASLRGVIFIYALYGIAHAAVSRIPGPALALDDVKLNVLTQSLQAGYLRENPPLFEWLLYSIQFFFGPTLLSFLVLKYALMVCIGALTFLIMELLLTDKRWAALSTFSLVFLYQIGWNYHQAFTHSLVLIATTLFFWWALLSLIRQRMMSRFAIVGIAIGLGVLAKYSFVGSAVAAFVALILNRDYRSVLATPKVIVTLMVAVLVISPHFFWVMQSNAGVADEAISRLQGEDMPYLKRLTQGIPAVIWAFVAFFLPFALIIGGIFKKNIFKPRQTSLMKLLRDAALIGAVSLFLAVIGLGIPSLQERYVIAFFIPAFFWVMCLIKVSNPSRKHLQLYGASVIVIWSFFLGLRLVQTAVPGKPFCSSCRQWIPYSVVAEKLNEIGFKDGTLVGYTDHTAGNLRRLFPDARVLSSHLPSYRPPGGDMSSDCYFIWSPSLAPPPSGTLIARFDPLTTETILGQWRHYSKENGWRTTEWIIAKLNHDPALVQTLCKPADI